jgi:hypothetical protein
LLGNGSLLSHTASPKEKRGSPQEIDKAVARLSNYKQNPKKHNYPEDVIDG